jgi:hypothetical protein
MMRTILSKMVGKGTRKKRRRRRKRRRKR